MSLIVIDESYLIEYYGMTKSLIKTLVRYYREDIIAMAQLFEQLWLQLED